MMRDEVLGTGLSNRFVRHKKFRIDLEEASAQANFLFEKDDDLIARFCALSELDQHNLSLVLNCYAWSAYDLEHHSKNATPLGHPFFQAGTPGDSSGIHLLAGVHRVYTLEIVNKLVRADGARAIYVKSGDPLPVLPPHERLIAGIVCRLDSNEYDFHFMAQGSSGYWSNVPGFKQFPSMFDDARKLISDPRRACFLGQRKKRVLFFAVPREGLKINCNLADLIRQFNSIGAIFRTNNQEQASLEIDRYMADLYGARSLPGVVAHRVEGELRRLRGVPIRV